MSSEYFSLCKTADPMDQLPVGYIGIQGVGWIRIKQDFQALHLALESLKLAVKYAILVQASDVL